MTTILKANPHKVIQRTADELKKQKFVQPPAWSNFVKTGHSKDRLPENTDWWYVRAASVLRAVAKLGPVGTEKLRTKYGSKKNRGHKPERFYKASGSILRKVLQQLEKSQLIKQTQKDSHKGRILTPKGTSLLDKIAVAVAKEEHAALKK